MEFEDVKDKAQNARTTKPKRSPSQMIWVYYVLASAGTAFFAGYYPLSRLVHFLVQVFLVALWAFWAMRIDAQNKTEIEDD